MAGAAATTAGAPVAGGMVTAGTGGAVGPVAGNMVGNPGGAGGSTVMPMAGSTMQPAGMGGSVMQPGGSGGSGGTTAPPIAAKGWTMMGGDLRNTYWRHDETKITAENAAMLQELWTFTVSGTPPGSPVVADGKVFVMATGGSYGIDLNTGMKLWENLAVKGVSSLAYDGEFVYAHNEKAELFKLKASDGTVVWGPVKTFGDVGGSDGTSSPILAGGKVLVGHSTANEIVPPGPMDQIMARGGVFAADMATGMMAWHYYTVELPENGAMVWSTVSVDEAAGIVYASTGNNYTVAGMQSDAIHAIELATGKRLWSKQVRTGDTWVLNAPISQDTDFGANPILADVDGKKIVAAGDKGSAFWALDRTTGNILWMKDALSSSHGPANGGVLNNGAFDGEAFYVISNQPTGNMSAMHKFKAVDGTPLWPAPKMFPTVVWGAPSGANGLLFVPVNTDLVVMKASDGTELKRFNTGGTIVAGAPAVVDGKIVVKSGMSYPLDFTGSVKMNNQIRCYGFK